MKKVLFVCHGNICRSPMAEFVFRDLLEKRGLRGIVTASAATSAEELGHPVHPGTRRKLAEHGIRCDGKTARRLTRADYAEYDLIVGMDAYNLRNMQTLFGGDPEHKLCKLLSFCGEGGDVADPWFSCCPSAARAATWPTPGSPAILNRPGGTFRAAAAPSRIVWPPKAKGGPAREQGGS